MNSISRVVPILVYDNIATAHDFLIGAFGFTSGGLHRTPDGQVVHGEVRAGENVIWLHRAVAELKMCSPRLLPAASSGLVVYVANVDAHFERARSRGAQIDREPQDMPYGQREYGATDREGHRWWFAALLQPEVSS
jgi:uncharacterized glyoxalase superfamily protein PhnB